ncbi:MAG TPA: TetR/AcrR family transcriptional regulator [Aldersonia sp.]
MQQVSEGRRGRQGRQRPADKFVERREQLARSALATLAELGYARTSLREIAQNSEFSHGVVHYYFDDKLDLIIECVRLYKAECATRYDEVVATSATAAELATGFADAMAETLQAEAKMHRLWYDLRAQALFEDSFRADVREIDARLEEMIWSVVSRYSELAEVACVQGRRQAYALFDGTFQQALLRWLSGDTDTPDDLRGDVTRLLDLIVPAQR